MNPLNILALGKNDTLEKTAVLAKNLNIEFHYFNPLKIIPIDWHAQNPEIFSKKIDKIIVISPNAAKYGLKFSRHFLSFNIPIFTIGKVTANLVKDYGYSEVFYPKTYTSEGLLSLKNLQNCKNQTILIFKGENGRPFLQETLQERGAIVYTIDCYFRKIQLEDIKNDLLSWKTKNIKLVIISNTDSLIGFTKHLLSIDSNWLKELTLLVTSKRLEKLAFLEGFKKIICASHFSPEALYEKLKLITF